MDSFSILPNDIHLELLHQLATADVHALYNLALASPIDKSLFETFSRTLLDKASTTILPSRPEFVRGALQALSSAKTMTLSILCQQGDELNAWKVRSADHDIWSNSYTGPRLDALRALLDLHTEIEHFVTDLLHRCALISAEMGEHVIQLESASVRQYMQATGSADTLLDAPRERVVEAVWLQEMQRFRNSNRDGGDLEAWYAMHNHAFNTTTPTSTTSHERRVAAAALAQKQQSALYLTHQRQIQRTHTETKNLGRKLQWLLKLSHAFEPEPSVQVRRLLPLCERWEWLPTRQGVRGALETDHDMLVPVGPYGTDEGVADRLGAGGLEREIFVRGGKGD